ncbi:hypothetical protein ABMA28_012939 [Loxostege sticticalis]|uniref:Uncharacterized protein n=1 Tax=Loxostege sticticalis TaxID=481309 RepID=A0ABD0S5B0_LOXSC
MRSKRRLKTTKSTYRHKVNKRRYNSNCTLGCTNCVSILDIENINEVLRVHKSQRAEGKGAWKVVPKDSCEVYKDRRKRQAVNNHRDEDDAKMRKTDSHRTPSRNKKSQKRNDDKKSRKEAVKKTRRRRKPNQRREPNTSFSSFTSTTTSCVSCMSSSEMDYDD